MMHNDWTDTRFYFIPAFLVIMGMFAVVRRFTDHQLSLVKKLMDRDLQLKAMEERSAKQREALPLKLQAYERLILFMERISPNSLLVRVHQGNMGAQLLHLELLSNIRAEFEHNLSQQLYVSEEAWATVVSAKDEMVEMVNNAFQSVGAGAGGVQMSAKIFEQVLGTETLPTQEAILFLKNEAQRLFV